MIATIDRGGRVVVPKDVRERLGLTPGTRVELVEADGHLEIAPAVAPMHLEEVRDQLVAVPDHPLPTLTAEEVRRVVEAQRR